MRKKIFDFAYGFPDVVGLLDDKIATKAPGPGILRSRVVGKGWRRLALLCLVATVELSLTFGGNDARAQGESRAVVYDIDIPSSSVADALNRLSEQTGAIMLFPYDLANERQANAVAGRYTLMEALDRLLDGSGLSSGLSEKRVIEIFVAESQSPKDLERGKDMNGARKGISAFLASIFAVSGANAQTTDGNSTGNTLEEIVVTAQKREQSLQDVPISIAVLTGSRLDSGQYEGVVEALNEVGGVNLFKNFHTGAAQASIRGVTAGAPLFSGGSTVGYYIDDVPFGFVKSSVVPDTNEFDLARVEVLRGPQGTLYGANALNGVIRVLTKEANLDEFEFKARSTVSTTDGGGENFRGDMAVNVPLVPGKLAARAVAGYSDLSGWIDKPVRDDANDAELTNFRFKLNAQPTDALSAEFVAWFSRDDYGAPSAGLDDGTHPGPADEPLSADFDMFGLKVAYDFEKFSIESSTSHIDYSNFSVLDIALGTDVLTTYLDAEVFAQELRFSSNLEGQWQWSFGGFYRDAEDPIVQTLPVLFDYAAAGLSASESTAIFGELTRSFLEDRVQLTVGVRSFQDTVTTKSLIAPGEEFPNGGPDALPLLDIETDFDSTTPRVVLNWVVDEDLSWYASYSQGFRSGYEQSSGIKRIAPELPAVEPDKLTNYEFGAKGSLANGRLVFDTAVYYIDWQDVQQQVGVEVGNSGAFRIAGVNGDSASGLGVDLNLVARATERLNLTLTAGWNDLTLDSDVLSSGILLFDKGERIGESPETTIGLTADYAVSFSGGYEGRFSGSVNHHTELTARTISGGARVVSVGDDITTSRLSASLTSPQQHWNTSLFVENLNNEDGAARVNEAVPHWSSRLRPRTVGIQVVYQY